LPFSFYEIITRWITLQRKERLGVRKYFANSNFMDTHLLPALGSALLALGAWLLLRRKRRG
jgi:LPXTG-motif cell wall-anchored protein